MYLNHNIYLALNDLSSHSIFFLIFLSDCRIYKSKVWFDSICFIKPPVNLPFVCMMERRSCVSTEGSSRMLACFVGPNQVRLVYLKQNKWIKSCMMQNTPYVAKKKKWPKWYKSGMLERFWTELKCSLYMYQWRESEVRIWNTIGNQFQLEFSLSLQSVKLIEWPCWRTAVK